MVLPLSGALRRFKHLLKHRNHSTPANPALTLAHTFTGNFGFVDEQTHKSHALSISPELDIKIDGRSLPGHVTGITTNKLTFLDHYGYQLIVTCGEFGPESVYDEAEDATYRIVLPDTPPDDQSD